VSAHDLRTRASIISLGAGLAIAAGLAVVVAQAPDVQTIGPKIGERVAEFTLPDQHGSPRALRSMFGPKGAVLVFFRSADW
jgi:hypothetical protein